MRLGSPILLLLGLTAFSAANACSGSGDPPNPGTATPAEDSGIVDDVDADTSSLDGGADAKSDAGDAGRDGDPGPSPLKRVRFALLGDYGVDNAAESAVAQLLITEDPDFIVTLGDNNYPSGLASTIDANIGKYYHSFISPYTGTYGQGAAVNRFWPCLGNHDWASGTMQPYADYFALPGNERYWELLRGSVHFFCLDSDPAEPDGRTPSSTQGKWLTTEMAKSTAPFKLVLMHHPPYSSGNHGSTTTMQWPFASYGADGVFAGHDHTYERLESDGLPYVVQGTGGAALYSIGTPVAQSRFAYDGSHGATLVRADDHFVVFESITTSRELIDVFSVAAKGDSSVTKRPLFAKATTWSYKDDGVAPPSTWTDAAFDASAWKSGPALLGYGQAGVQTTVSYGSNAAQKHVTTYFRRTFDVQRLDDVAWLSLAMRKDDGAVVYINGAEAHRSNMPKGAIGPQTEAAYRLGYVAEDAWEPVALDASLLKVGTNAISVELHQSGANTSDALFDASLDAVLR